MKGEHSSQDVSIWALKLWVNHLCQDAIPVLGVILYVGWKQAFAGAEYGNTHSSAECMDLYFPPAVIHDLSKGNRFSKKKRSSK